MMKAHLQITKDFKDMEEGEEEVLEEVRSISSDTTMEN